MEIRHLKYFITVGEELNFRKAAERLHISQPPLSRQIKELETEMGAKLFNRNNKKVELTDAGKYFQREVYAMLNKLDQVKSHTKRIGNSVSGEFRIAYISSTFSSIIPELIAHLRQNFPYVHFQLFEEPTLSQVEGLVSGRLDFGIIRSPFQSPGIKSQLWYNDGYSLIFHKDHFNMQTEFRYSDLNSATFVYFNKDYSPQNFETLFRIGSQLGFTPNVVHEANNMNSILQLVRNGLGVSIVPSGVCNNLQPDDNIHFFELNIPGITTDVFLATPEIEKKEITESAISFLKNEYLG